MFSNRIEIDVGRKVVGVECLAVGRYEAQQCPINSFQRLLLGRPFWRAGVPLEIMYRKGGIEVLWKDLVSIRRQRLERERQREVNSCTYPASAIKQSHHLNPPESRPGTRGGMFSPERIIRNRPQNRVGLQKLYPSYQGGLNTFAVRHCGNRTSFVIGICNQRQKDNVLEKNSSFDVLRMVYAIFERGLRGHLCSISKKEFHCRFGKIATNEFP